jgi:monofunctional biosynthetic peptidoglycan transglycosylase
MKGALRGVGRLLALLALSALALQLCFAARIALMAVVDPQSTSFQRSEVWRLLTQTGRIVWSQQWLPYARISNHLKRAVIASEDAAFADHAGIDWDALEKAWERNQQAAEREARLAARPARPMASTARKGPKIVGGSTITQQLAKNLFLSGERQIARKAQEAAITLMLEALLSKQRILEIYLNNVEWGEGLFGAEAASRHYFHVGAGQLTPYAAARLAVMLPAPKRFEKRPGSAYVVGRAATIVARMGDVEAP